MGLRRFTACGYFAMYGIPVGAAVPALVGVAVLGRRVAVGTMRAGVFVFVGRAAATAVPVVVIALVVVSVVVGATEAAGVSATGGVAVMMTVMTCGTSVGTSVGRGAVPQPTIARASRSAGTPRFFFTDPPLRRFEYLEGDGALH